MSLLLAALLTGAGAAAPAPVSVSAAPAKTEVTVGEPFVVEVRASGPAGTTYTFPAEAGDEQVELRALPAPPSPPPPPDRLSYQAAVFALENPRLPPVRVKYRLADGSEGEAESAPVELKVATLLPRDPKEQAPADIRGPMSLDVGRAFWIGAGLLALALAALVAWLVRRRRATPAGAPARPATPPTSRPWPSWRPCWPPACWRAATTGPSTSPWRPWPSATSSGASRHRCWR